MLFCTGRVYSSKRIKKLIQNKRQIHLCIEKIRQIGCLFLFSKEIGESMVT